MPKIEIYKNVGTDDLDECNNHAEEANNTVTIGAVYLPYLCFRWIKKNIIRGIVNRTEMAL